MSDILRFILPILLVVIGTSVVAQTKPDSKERIRSDSSKIDSLNELLDIQRIAIDSLNNIVNVEYSLVNPT